jgi:hypothetical protein
MRVPSYRVVHEDNDVVAIVDLNKGLSITNGAEAVIDDLETHLDGGLGDRKVVYQDTTGQWDELCHDGNGFFLGFGHIGARTAAQAISFVKKG